jgi:hypothetical protein
MAEDGAGLKAIAQSWEGYAHREDKQAEQEKLGYQVSKTGLIKLVVHEYRRSTEHSSRLPLPYRLLSALLHGCCTSPHQQSVRSTLV